MDKNEMLNNWDVTVNMMDDDIREEIHAEGYDNKEDFLDAYITAHKVKYGEDFIIN